MDNIFCTFYIGKNEFALHVKMIQEVVNYPAQLIKMPLAPNFLLGVFNLRGMIIPVVDLRSILRLPPGEEGGEQKVGICDLDGVKIGVLFDRTSEILRPSADNRNNFDFLANEKKVVAGAIKLDDGERIIQIINPFVLLSVENMPAIIGKQKSRTSDFGSHAFSGRKKCITFTLDSMNMAFEITGIKEIIRVPEIKASSANMESCIGVVNLRGKTIPVVDFSKLLGIDNKVDTSSSEARIIILKREQDLFGLLVNEVGSIQSFQEEDIMPIPLLSKERMGLFKGGVHFHGIGDSFLLDEKEVLIREEVAEVTAGHARIYGRGEADEKVKRYSKRVSYITFRLDHLFGIFIKDVREIISYPKNLSRAPGLPKFVRGVLNLRGSLITIVDGRELYGLERVELDKEKVKVLIIDDGQEKYGLIVDSLESILSLEEDKKRKVPSLMVSKVKDQFDNDIQEILTLEEKEQWEDVLFILGHSALSSRIKKSVAA